MNPEALTPELAAEAADSPYALRLSEDVMDAAIASPKLRQKFEIVSGTAISAKSGMGAVSKKTGFGYFAQGTGSREGELLIAIRGTFAKSGYDWLTNVRIGAVRGPSGYAVHRGFWTLASEVFDKIQAQLDVTGGKAVHVVGHSLGGAAATLVADAVSGLTNNVRLYTFGAPRSGVELHAQHLTTTLRPDHIFRVYHHNDPVPMVPIFPYSHVPYEHQAYYLEGPGMLLSLAAHKTGNYAKSVGSSDWEGLPVIQHPFARGLDSARKWLAQAADFPGGMLSATLLRMVLSALKTILKYTGRGAGLALLGGATVVDYIARVLYAGASTLGESLVHLVRAIFKFLGRPQPQGVSITATFLQWVLDMLFRTVASMAKRAVDPLGV